MYRLAVCLNDFDSGLHRFFQTKGTILHALELDEHVNKLVAKPGILDRYRQLLSPIPFQIIVQMFYSVLLISLLIAVRSLIVNGFSRIFVFVLVSMRPVLLFYHQL